MQVMMLGADYEYGLLPRSESLGAFDSKAFTTNLQNALNVGRDVAVQWLKTQEATATTEAERIKASSALADIRAGKNPVAQSIPPYTIAIAGGAVVIVALLIMKKKRKKR